jgi:hypothetical protein
VLALVLIVILCAISVMALLPQIVLLALLAINSLMIKLNVLADSAQ